jgi:hypothetical protein
LFKREKKQAGNITSTRSPVITTGRPRRIDLLSLKGEWYGEEERFLSKN